MTDKIHDTHIHEICTFLIQKNGRFLVISEGHPSIGWETRPYEIVLPPTVCRVTIVLGVRTETKVKQEYGQRVLFVLNIIPFEPFLEL